ncbi:PilN domain-containing protein [Synechococcus sp. H55.11]|uniref:PilN domain-containing protein n=1 Tax=Synechococcus sp. H55.11 TaxID=2967121 RepID=UPI0039C4A507
MYTPEINFLKERPDVLTAAQAGGGAVAAPTTAAGAESWALAIGLGVAVTAVAMGTFWYFQDSFSRQRNTLRAERTRLDGELSTANAELTRLQGLSQELQTIRTQTEGFRSFLGSVQPWSAILEEVRRRIPGRGVWITNISASGDTVNIQGGALDFPLVNDFLLTLLDSNFVTSAVLNSASRVEGTPETEPSVTYGLTVTIRTIGDPDPEFTRELEQRGAIGLVEKIRILRQVEGN